MQEDQQRDVVLNREEERFETEVDGDVAFLTYALEGGRLFLLHTDVPEPSEGQGIGSELVRSALEYARSQGLSVVPMCSFVRVYLQRNSEYQDLVQPS